MNAVVGGFRRLLRRPPPTPDRDELTRLWQQQEALPILSASELILVLDQSKRMMKIRRLSAVDDAPFDELYKPAITAFLEAVQLMPASLVDHHRLIGGLAVHTLEVIERALVERKGHLLPLHSSADVVSREEHLWTYAVFAAALLHDAGKTLTLFRLLLDDGRICTAAGPPIRESGARTYRLEPLPSNYSLQMRCSITLLSLIPPLSREMLLKNPAILSELIGYLSDDPYEAGSIGRIVRRADMGSVAKNRDPSVNQLPMRSVAVRPLHDRMMRALRTIIHRDDTIVWNLPTGAGAFLHDGFAYLVRQDAATAIRNQLTEERASDIPRKASRILDALREHHYAEATEDGQTTHYVLVESGPHLHALSTVKFRAERLLHIGSTREPFVGTVTEVSREEALYVRAHGHRKDQSPALVPAEAIATLGAAEKTPPAAALDTADEQGPAPSDRPAGAEPDTAPEKVFPAAEPDVPDGHEPAGPSRSTDAAPERVSNADPLTALPPEGQPTVLEDDELDELTSWGPEVDAAPDDDEEDLDTRASASAEETGGDPAPNPSPTASSPSRKRSDRDGGRDRAASVNVSRRVSPKTVASAADGLDLERAVERALYPGRGEVQTDPVSLEDPTIGRYFVSWIGDVLSAGALRVNLRDSPAHITASGVALVSPDIFRRFVLANRLADDEEPATVDKAWRRVQAKLFAERLHIKSPTNRDLWHVHVSNPLDESVARRAETVSVSYSKITIALLPTAIVYDDKEAVPSINPFLDLKIPSKRARGRRRAAPRA